MKKMLSLAVWLCTFAEWSALATVAYAQEGNNDRKLLDLLPSAPVTLSFQGALTLPASKETDYFVQENGRYEESALTPDQYDFAHTAGPLCVLHTRSQVTGAKTFNRGDKVVVTRGNIVFDEVDGRRRNGRLHLETENDPTIQYIDCHGEMICSGLCFTIPATELRVFDIRKAFGWSITID